ncbi:lipoprotein-releasing system ATP-binding protein LolD [Candidatus Woesearchaeota archaeon]|nr:MAG: lipoprotein-releasing system ATP-binding protein LolD [Candidatus Woesearchaeota archaeon]
MSSQKAIIKVKDVWKTYNLGENQVHALRGLNVEIKQGEFVAIMGPSGSGKSTAMNMIGCLDTPSKGKIFLDGEDISHLNESDLAQIRGKKIGFIFQKFNLINTLTAKENIMLPLMFQGVSLEIRRKRAEDLLNMVGLGERMNHKPNELSGGQQQRVAIARALAVEPDVILADEPTGNLDTKTGENVMDFLKKLHKEKHTTIVLVTHDEEVGNHADRLEFLKDGMIIKSKERKPRGNKK